MLNLIGKHSLISTHTQIYFLKIQNPSKLTQIFFWGGGGAKLTQNLVNCIHFNRLSESSD